MNYLEYIRTQRSIQRADIGSVNFVESIRIPSINFSILVGDVRQITETLLLSGSKA